MSLWPPAPAPKSRLGYYRMLSPNSGIRVSPICLGTMNFGTAWASAMGTVEKRTAFDILDEYHQNGGNFIDISNNYQDEQAEQWVGEWMENRNCRDQMVVATKYSTLYPAEKDFSKNIYVNYSGNSAKSLKLSVEASLKKLRTSYIDIMYLHWWDYVTPVAEVMNSLNDLVVAGKVLYLGVSDTPAWWVSKANEYARCNGLRQFIVYQGHWSAADRDFELDIIPMCRAEGMGIAPFGVLGGGNFKTEAQFKSEDRRKLFPPSEKQLKISKVLERLAVAKGVKLTDIAFAYVMSKFPWTVPVLGGRNTEQLRSNIKALSIELTKNEVQEIEDANPFPRGFPYGLMAPQITDREINASDCWVQQFAGHLDLVELPKPIGIRKSD